MSETIKLTKAEKFIVMLLCDLSKRIEERADIKERYFDLKDYAFIEEAVRSGHYWALDDKYTISEPEPISDSIVSETIQILAMWDTLTVMYERLSQKDRDRVVKEAREVRFPGFYGNDEIEHLSVARFLIDRMGKFKRFKRRDLDSHGPFLEGQRRMLKVFDRLFRETVFKDFSAAQIIEVLNEQIHPSNR